MNTLALSNPTVRASAAPNRSQRPQQQRTAAPPGRRALLAGLAGAGLLAAGRPALAALEIKSIDFPDLDVSAAVQAQKARNQTVLDDAESSFQNSDLLKTLKERSDANRGARKKELEERYCMRQAELGVGDCGGLRLIPGMTKSGVQVRPDWMEDLGQKFGLVKGAE